MASNSHLAPYAMRDARPPFRAPVDPEVREVAEQAARCRRLAQQLDDARTISALKAMAVEYEARARLLRND